MAQMTGSTTDKISDKMQEMVSGSEMGHKAENVSRQIEEKTAKVPTTGFLALAVGSMLASAGLALFSKRKELANFVGLWAPSLLLLGVYNKLVKLEHAGQMGSQGGNWMRAEGGERIGSSL